MAQSSTTFHEREGALKPETRDRHCAIVSIMEELEAVGWDDQRIDAAAIAGTTPSGTSSCATSSSPA
jgi:hypothetical protein